MGTAELTIRVQQPTEAEFYARSPQAHGRYRGLLETPAGRQIFDLVRSPEAFNRSAVLTDVLGIPAVTGVADAMAAILPSPAPSVVRQFIGAVTMVMMEANGYEKTERSGSVPHPFFNRGAIYRRATTRRPGPAAGAAVGDVEAS